MAIAERFMFDTAFDELDELSTVGRKNELSDTFSQSGNNTSANDIKLEKELEEEKRIEQIREENYQNGKKDGNSEALMGIEESVNKLLITISDEMNNLEAKQDLVNKEISDNLILLTQTIIKKIFPTLAKNSAVEEIIKVIVDLPKLYTEEPEILVKINPLIINQLNDRLSEKILDNTRLKKLKLVEDSSVEEGDCQIDWSNGSAERNLDKLVQKMDDIIAQNINSINKQNNDEDGEKSLTTSNETNDKIEDQNEEIFNTNIVESKTETETIIRPESDDSNK
ncbi:FliH/SctL family protein [Rhodospirillales bacterium]|nr:FliH/SctL family protein [Rhodospirillales bacterium]